MAIKLGLDAGQFLDDVTKSNLDAVRKNRLGRKYDYVVLITADKTGVGEGKSCLFHLLCTYMDPDNFTMDRVFFDELDYRMEEKRLKPLSAFGFDEPDAFFSTEATTRQQRRIKLKFTKIRQKMHFIVICAPSIFDVARWIRGLGQSRVNCIFRVIRRGVYYAYGDKTGALDAIRLDEKARKIIWPESDFIGFFKKIPEESEWWDNYIKKKNRYLKQADDNPKAVMLMKKEQAKMQNALTIANIAEIHKVHPATVRRWRNLGVFGKTGSFVGLDGNIYVKMQAYNKGIKRVMRLKQIGAAKHGKRGKDKTKRKRGSGLNRWKKKRRQQKS